MIGWQKKTLSYLVAARAQQVSPFVSCSWLMHQKGKLSMVGLVGSGCVSGKRMCFNERNVGNHQREFASYIKLKELVERKEEIGKSNVESRDEESHSEKLPDFNNLPKQVQETLLKISETPEHQRVSFSMRVFHALVKQYEHDMSVLTPSFYNIIAFNVARKHKHLKSTMKLVEMFEQLGVMSQLLHRYVIICMTDPSNMNSIPLGEVWNFLFKYKHFVPHQETFRKFLIALIDKTDSGEKEHSLDKVIINSDLEYSKSLGFVNQVPVNVKIRYVLMHMIKYDIQLSWKHYRPLVLALIRENQKDLILSFFETLYPNKTKLFEDSPYFPLTAITAHTVPGFSSLDIKESKQPTQMLWPLRKTGKIQLISIFVKECSASKLSDVAQYIFKKTTRNLSMDTKSINAILNTMIESNDIQVFDLYKEFRQAYSHLINVATISIMLKGYTRFISLTTDSTLQVLLYKNGKEVQHHIQELNLTPDNSYVKNVLWFYSACNTFIEISMQDVDYLFRSMKRFGIKMEDEFLVYIVMALSNSEDGVRFFQQYLKRRGSVDINVWNWVLKTCLNTGYFNEAIEYISMLTTSRDNPSKACYNEETFKIYFNIWKQFIMQDKVHEFPIETILKNMENCFSEGSLEPSEDLLSSLGSVLIKFYEKKDIRGEALLKNTMSIIAKYYPNEMIVSKPKLVSLALSSVIGKGVVDVNLLEKTVAMLETYDESFFDTIHYTQLLRIVNLSNTPNRWKLMRIVLQKMANSHKIPNLITLQMIVEIVLKEMPHMYTLLLQILSVMKNRLIFDSEGTEVHVRSKEKLSQWLEEVSKLISDVKEQETKIADKDIQRRQDTNL